MHHHIICKCVSGISREPICWRRESLRLLSASAISGPYKSTGVIYVLTSCSIPPRLSHWAGVVEYIKRRDHARTYLLLKDIFPQNAVDIGILKKSGLKGLIYRYFRAKEKKLYAISDRIGCMSQANVDYLLRQDPELDPAKVELCPNSVEPLERTITAERRRELREKYGIPQDKTVFLYGGNLGRPQGVPFIMDCLRACRNRQDCFSSSAAAARSFRLCKPLPKQSGCLT